MINFLIVVGSIGVLANGQISAEPIKENNGRWITLGATSEMAIAVNEATIRSDLRHWGTKDAFILIVLKQSSEKEIFDQKYSFDYLNAHYRVHCRNNTTTELGSSYYSLEDGFQYSIDSEMPPRPIDGNAAMTALHNAVCSGLPAAASLEVTSAEYALIIRNRLNR